ncbi:unnamed protein product [Ectocarpus sp. 13 AM-2016]
MFRIGSPQRIIQSNHETMQRGLRRSSKPCLMCALYGTVRCVKQVTTARHVPFVVNHSLRREVFSWKRPNATAGTNRCPRFRGRGQQQKSPLGAVRMDWEDSNDQ